MVNFSEKGNRLFTSEMSLFFNQQHDMSKYIYFVISGNYGESIQDGG
jgi:hypothetical protein